VGHSGNGELYTVNPATGESATVAGVSVPAVDGLLLEGGRLWAVQNGPNQIAEIRLRRDLSYRPRRSKSVASKAAMLALSSRPTRCRRSGSRAVRMRSAPLARASRAVSSPMPELPPITRTV
jgi:hypothetical protein